MARRIQQGVPGDSSNPFTQRACGPLSTPVSRQPCRTTSFALAVSWLVPPFTLCAPIDAHEATTPDAAATVDHLAQDGLSTNAIHALRRARAERKNPFRSDRPC
jgi:hypothetical protein